MLEHSFVNISSVTLRDNLFIFKDNFIIFYPLGENQTEPFFDISIHALDKEREELKKVVYFYDTFYSNKTNIVVKSDNPFFKEQQITVFPNYWLRIHASYSLNDENFDLILEYKNVGNTDK